MTTAMLTIVNFHESKVTNIDWLIEAKKKANLLCWFQIYI